MVGINRNRSWIVIAALALVLTLLLLTTTAVAQEEGQEVDEYYFIVSEEYNVDINDVGDAAITDHVSYDPSWFAEVGYVFEEYPNLLSRRYRADTNIGELENFDVNVDSESSSITVTLDAPGLVYKLGDEWVLYGYSDYEVSSVGDDQVVLTGSWLVTGEYTLFEELGWEDTVTIDLPDGATGARYDEEDGAIYYQLAYTGETASASFLEENKTTMLIVFAVLMGLSLLLFILVVTRKEKEPPAQPAVAQAAPPTVPPTAAQAPPPSAPPTAAQAPPPSAQPTAQAAPPAEQEAAPTFCKKCGKPTIKEGASFCKNCGTPFD
jgi:hypothetical protein